MNSSSGFIRDLLPFGTIVPIHFSKSELVMVQCQQIKKAIGMILDYMRQTQQKKPVALRQTDSGRWKIMQMPDQPAGTFLLSIGRVNYLI